MSESRDPAGGADPAGEPEPPVLPDRPEHERDEAWGERTERDAEWFRRERPPHHE